MKKRTIYLEKASCKKKCLGRFFRWRRRIKIGRESLANLRLSRKASLERSEKIKKKGKSWIYEIIVWIKRKKRHREEKERWRKRSKARRRRKKTWRMEEENWRRTKTKRSWRIRSMEEHVLSGPIGNLESKWRGRNKKAKRRIE